MLMTNRDQWGETVTVSNASLLSALERYAAIPEEEWLYFQSRISWKTVRKGEYLLHSGQPCEQIHYCVHGLFRMFYENEDGSEHIKSFVTEEQFFTDYRSFLTDSPSFLSIQALEDSRYASFS
jgi:CRP-like cAMP-binding protein